jgi:glycosyltransferase involved in cell wall biosynthesis
LVVIPARNEASTIAEVIAEIRRYTDLTILVVDDASTDDTARQARAAGARVLTLAAHLGAWGGIQAGLRLAQREGFQWVITMDADGQHEAAYLETLLDPVIAGRVDVAIGAFVARASRLRRVGWVLLRAVSGLGVEDVTSGFRAYNRRAIEMLAGREATLIEYQDIGVLFMLCHSGLRIGEYEVSMRPRRSGMSRVYSSWRMVFYYMTHSLLLGASKRGRRRCIRDLGSDSSRLPAEGTAP